MSNQNRKGNSSSGVNPLGIAAAVGIGALAAVGGYLFGRFQEASEAEANAAKVPQQRPSQTRDTTHAQPPRQRSLASTNDDEVDEDLQKPGGARDRECVICFREFDELMKNDEEIHTTPCGHVYCLKCIRKALTEKGRCPICRTHVDPDHTLRIFL